MRNLLAAVVLAATATATVAAAPVAVPAESAPRAAQTLLTRVTPAGKQLVAVGARGHILRSVDGEQWTQSPSPVNVLLTSVFFLDEQIGWAVGHDATILHSRDGGARWAVQHFDPALNLPLLDVVFTSATRGVAIGAYGLMLETNDGGATWTRMESPLTEEGLHFNAVSPLGDGSLLMVGEQGMLARSTDEGRTWTRLASPYSSSLFAVVPDGGQGAVIGGLRGNVYRSDDVAAGTWTRMELGGVESVFGMARLADDRVGLVGLNASLQIIAADGSVMRGAWSIANAQPGVELGSLSGLAYWKDRIVSVGDAGVILWVPAATP